MREDAAVGRRGLIAQVTERTVSVDAVHSDRTPKVEGCQQILAGHIDAAVDWARRKRLRRAMRRQSAGAGIDPERMSQMRVAGNHPGTAVA